MEKKIELQIEGMSCGHCVNAVNRLLTGEGVISSQVFLESQTATVVFDDEKTDSERIMEMVNHSGMYHAKGLNQ